MKNAINLPRKVLYYGRDEDLPDTRTLRAGPVSCVYENGDLRFITCGDVELIRRIYAAVRDHNWGTVLPVFSRLIIQDNEDSFSVTYQADHKQGDVDFTWNGSITGAEDGTITFEMDGVCNAGFLKNRIGFCVLHPMTCAGNGCTVEQADGSSVTGSFPELISPHQPFMNMKAVNWEAAAGLTARIGFEGEVFEMEDQRNWTDASYKTYCTPLGRPFPVGVKKGQKIKQKIKLTVDSGQLTKDKINFQQPTSNIQRPTENQITITVDQDKQLPLPGIGIGSARDGRALSAPEAKVLKMLKPDHLRADLDLDDAKLEQKLARADAEAQQLGTQLLAALFFNEDHTAELENLAKAVKAVWPGMKAVIIYSRKEKSTTKETLAALKPKVTELFPQARIGTGTDAFFTELNRERPPADDVNFVTYSLNPQVHAFDNTSLAETCPAQGVTVASARAFTKGKPVYVTPVTFKMRWNPNATGPEPEPEPEPRQMSLFGAAWTLGSIKYLAEAGAASITYYETTGTRGVMAPENAKFPPDFRAIPGMVYPLFHVLADLMKAAGSTLTPCISSDPLAADALMVTGEDGTVTVHAVNYTDREQVIGVRVPGKRAYIRRLNEDSAARALTEPTVFLKQEGEEVPVPDGDLVTSLKPYEYQVIRLN